jgi:cellulose synthase/poly-beta-1,6-N-acetylglucosamine synthase-like glycosyltransferase
MEFSIIVATYDRCDSLRRLLTGIRSHFGALDIEHEVIVANNARDDLVAQRIDQVMQEFSTGGGVEFRVVREPLAGKCRAQNTAIRVARGKVLAFFDDDVEVTPGWLRMATEFFQREPPFDVMQGPILVPPDMEHNEEFLRAQRRFRTIDFVQYAPQSNEITTLTGANMAVRRELFSKLGGFNEELGPGKSGMSEDVEFAQRVIRGGGRIGYEARAGVYHCVDWSRLTEEFFRKRHEQQGRSRLLFKKQSVAVIIPDILRSICMFGWYSIAGNERKKYRAKGRYFHYRAMLLEKAKTIAGNQT